jgi:ParB-like chromosome segregation protein Spo0J
MDSRVEAPCLESEQGATAAATAENGTATEQQRKKSATRERKNGKKDVQKRFGVELSETKDLPLESLYSEKDRTDDPKAFEELVQNLLAVKIILIPLIARPQPIGTKDNKVIAGRRRLAAAIEARKRWAKLHPGEPEIFTHIPCRIVTSPPSVTDDLIVAIVENVMRLEERPLDTAKKLKQVKETLGVLDADLADIYGLSRGTVHDLLEAIEMPKDWLERAEDVKDENGNVIKRGNLFKVHREYTQFKDAQAAAKKKGKKVDAEAWIKNQQIRKERERRAKARATEAAANGHTENGEGKQASTSTTKSLGHIYDKLIFPDGETGCTITPSGMTKKPDLTKLLATAQRFVPWLQSVIESM